MVGDGKGPWGLARRDHTGCSQRVDVATRYLGVCSHTWLDISDTENTSVITHLTIYHSGNGLSHTSNLLIAIESRNFRYMRVHMGVIKLTAFVVTPYKCISQSLVYLNSGMNIQYYVQSISLNPAWILQILSCNNRASVIFLRIHQAIA